MYNNEGTALGTGRRNIRKPRMGDIKSVAMTGSAPSGQGVVGDRPAPGRCPGLDYFRLSGGHIAWHLSLDGPLRRTS